VTEVLVALIVGASTLGGVVLTQWFERKRAAADRLTTCLSEGRSDDTRLTST
jgi:hypothetical protein